MLPPGPDTRVVELRVHGVMGTRPESLVSSVAAVDVAGDGLGRIVQPADRLLRPAPGPMLRAEGQSIPRVVEGYAWGGMTSGGWAKAAWAVLFPFALANVAHWMLPPIPSGHRMARGLGVACRTLLRLAAVLLTVLLVTQAAVVSLDLLAAQCLAPGSPCLAGTVPDWLRETYLVRPAIGLLPVLLTIYVLHRISCVAWEVDAGSNPGNPPPTPPNARVQLPGTNLVADPDTPTLRALHLVAALATVALLPLGGVFTVPHDPLSAALWTLALILLVVAFAGVLLLDDPRGATPGRAGAWLRGALGRVSRRVLYLIGVLLVVAAAASRDPLRLTATEQTVESIAAALIVVVVVFAVLLVPAARVARREWRARPRELRPWAGGWMAAPVLAVAALLGGGFGAGLGIAVRQLLGTDGMEVPAGYGPVTMLWGAGAVLGAVVALVTVPFALVKLRSIDSAEARLLGSPVREWRTAGWFRQHLHHVVLACSGALAAGAAVAIYLRFVTTPDWLLPLSTVGVLALGALAGGLLRAVYNAARAAESGRQLGVLADLACFWPREAHPIVPPCYAVKVAPEVAARAVSHLAEPGTRVVLIGESHGSLLVAVAAARLLNSLNEPERRRIGVVTVGSQLQWAYTRAFPAVLPFSAMGTLAAELGTRWRSLCRGTDPLGGAVSTWRRQVYEDSLLGMGFRADGTPGPLAAAERGPHGALVLGLDHWLPDPRPAPVPGRRWTPGLQRHANYASDPEWDRAVAMAAGLDPSEPPVLFSLGGGK
ncbi:hypothetical protein [Actinophytocola sp. NPDC049390]|uniref:hypothetical protein n=1 Tax=Actinophytocola sp. NPDC049390 TaxID=3363894 RepID=UPI0037880C89